MHYKVRPTAGRPKCLNRKLSICIDILLKSFLKHISSYIKAGLNLLNKYQRKTEHEVVILTFDIVSTFISITHDSGLHAIDYFLNPLSAYRLKWSNTFKQQRDSNSQTHSS